MVDAAVLAPSAENTQPWQFVVEGDELVVELDTSRWLPSDVDGMLALTGIGAAIENAVIAARRHGRESTVSYEIDSPPCRSAAFVRVASIDPGEFGASDSLFAFLKSRCTSRRLESRPIPPELLAQVSGSLDGISNVRLDWLTAPAEIRPLAKLIGVGNRLRFEHKPFHREFYDNLRFTRDEVCASRDGLDVETLQLPHAVKKILYGLRKWPRMRLANRLGFSRIVARQAAMEVRTSGAVGILSVDEPSPQAFLEGGRALERIWLAATGEDLGFHPTASLPVFLAHARRTDGSGLLAKHRPAVQDLSREFCRLFPQLADRTVQMVFRVGFADPPRARSLRRSIQEVIYP